MADYPVKIEMEEAARLLEACVHPTEKEQIFLADALGRVLAEEICSKENLPPFDRSPYDGYAFRAEDAASASPSHPVVLNIVEEVPAGHWPQRALQKNQASKILTGSPVPTGADAVAKFEETQFTRAQVRIFQPYRSGSNIVKAGEDISAGETVYVPGHVLSPASQGVLAGLGCRRIWVYRKPHVSIISTGDELLPIEQELLPGKIRNSSAYLLAGLLTEWGMEPEVYGIVGDDADAIAQAIEECRLRSDLVITTGGASVGDYDLVCQGLEQLSAQMLFWKVKMKPGMATLAAVKEGTPILGLSGNPSAAAAAFFLVGGPAFARLCGRREAFLEKTVVRLAQDFPKKSPGRRILPGVMELAEGRIWLNFNPKQANGRICTWDGCRLLGMIPAGSGPLPAGSEIEAFYLR